MGAMPALLVVGGVCALALMLWTTALGAGVSPDSVLYIDAARNLLAGKGLVALGIPLSHYPPGYPAVLALGGLAGIEPLAGARLLNALLFGLNAMLIGWLAYACAERRPAAGIAA